MAMISAPRMATDIPASITIRTGWTPGWGR